MLKIPNGLINAYVHNVKIIEKLKKICCHDVKNQNALFTTVQGYDITLTIGIDVEIHYSINWFATLLSL